MQKEILNTPLSLSALLQFHDAVQSYFSEKWAEGENNERRWLGKNWTAKQEAEIKEQGRQPYHMPLITSKLNIIASTQKQSRTQFKIEAASDPQDEIKAELATLRLRDIERRSKFKYIESDVFDSGLAVCFGATKVGLDYASYTPQIKIDSVDYKSLIWDINWREYDMSDCLFMAEIEKVPRYMLEKYYDMDTEGLTTGDNGAFQGRETINYYVKRNLMGNEDFDIISIFNHYQKVVRKYYCVIFPDSEQLYKLGSQIAGKFKTRKEAELRLRELNHQYLLKGFDFEGTIEEKNEHRLDRYKFAYNRLLEYEETDLEKFPYNCFFAFKYEDNFCSFMEFLKSPQIFIDRMWSQIDYAMGKDLKKIYELWTGGLADGETPESAMRKMNQTGGVVLKNQSQQIIQEFQGKGVNPQMFEIANIMQSYLEDLGGGRSFQGLSEGSNESGISVREKKAQGLLIAYTFMDNLSRFKQALGENLLWWLQKYDTAEQTIKIHGAALSPEMLQLLQSNGIYTPSLRNDGGGFVKINQEGNRLTYLNDAEFELIVTESDLSDFEREAKLIQMLDAERLDPTLAQSPTWHRLKLEYMQIGASDRQKILNEYQQAQQQQQAMAEQQMNMQKAEIISRMPLQNKQQSQGAGNGKKQ